jgi:hypothetical protein
MCSDSLVSKETGAPGDEIEVTDAMIAAGEGVLGNYVIEITPEMIEAGRHVWAHEDFEFGEIEEFVAHIFIEMVSVCGMRGTVTKESIDTAIAKRSRTDL